MDFGLVTNGRMLSYPQFLDKLLRRRLHYVYLSLHGATAKIHDANVRSQAFTETFGGLKNCSGHGLHLTANDDGSLSLDSRKGLVQMPRGRSGRAEVV